MAESDRRRPVHLDTDIGTDVDDLLALALLVAAPEVQLIGVTTVYGDTVLRARMTRLVLDQLERNSVPIGFGAQRQAGLVGRARGSRHSRARSGADR
jgi:inosine-uridine nucleoside N-ribohydrolase